MNGSYYIIETDSLAADKDLSLKLDSSGMRRVRRNGVPFGATCPPFSFHPQRCLYHPKASPRNVRSNRATEGAGLQQANITVDNLPAVVARARGIEQARARPAELSMPREALSRGGRPPLAGRARASDYSTLESTAMHIACAAYGLRCREIG
jgi:hypothetical protein